MATVDASRVFALLGAKGLEAQGDYHTAKMPPVNQGLLDGQLAWRQHDGGHTDAPNMKWFIEWADRFIDHTPPAIVGVTGTLDECVIRAILLMILPQNFQMPWKRSSLDAILPRLTRVGTSDGTAFRSAGGTLRLSRLRLRSVTLRPADHLRFAIAAIQRTIPISNEQFSYLQTGFLLSYAALYAIGGRLLDKLGTRRGFLLINALVVDRMSCCMALRLHLLRGSLRCVFYSEWEKAADFQPRRALCRSGCPRRSARPPWASSTREPRSDRFWRHRLSVWCLSTVGGGRSSFQRERQVCSG